MPTHSELRFHAFFALWWHLAQRGDMTHFWYIKYLEDTPTMEKQEPIWGYP